MSAVWQDCSASGTPCFFFTDARSATSSAVVGKPLSLRWVTQSAQQPQVADLYTVMAGLAAATGREISPAASVRPPARTARLEMSIGPPGPEHTPEGLRVIAERLTASE